MSIIKLASLTRVRAPAATLSHSSTPLLGDQAFLISSIMQQRGSAKWIIMSCICFSIIFVFLPSSSSEDQTHTAPRVHPLLPQDNAHHHEHKKPDGKISVPGPAPGMHGHENQAQPEAPEHGDHAPDHNDVLFKMPRPGERTDLLEAVLNPQQGFFGGQKIANDEHSRPRSMMWQAPTSGEPKGVLVLFHGCNHDGSDWFNGPAERRIVAHAIAEGLVAVAMQAGARHGAKCWQNDWPVMINNDVISTKASLLHWLEDPEREAWAKLPFFALGASSGGSFATVFARVFDFQAIAVEVSPGLHEAFAADSTLRPVPPVVFIYMTGDTTWASKSQISMRVQRLTERRLLAKAIEVAPRPITERLFYEYLDLPADRTRRIHQTMQKLGMIDSTGHLKGDPRALACGASVVKALSDEEPGFDWAYWEYGIQQIANLAEGSHEITFEGWPEALAWMRESKDL